MGAKYDRVAQDSETTPEEARAVWESLENPTLERVLDRLTSSGKKVTLATLSFWYHENWMVPSIEDIATKMADVDAKVPMITGNPRNGVKSILPKDVMPKNGALLPDKKMRSLAPLQRDLPDLSDDKLMRTATREAFIATTMIFREAVQQRRALIRQDPVAFGALLKSLAEVLDKTTGCADRATGIAERMIRAEAIAQRTTIDLTPDDDPIANAMSEMGRKNGTATPPG